LWGSFRDRYAIDPRLRPELPEITTVKAEWPAAVAAIPRQVSVITCLQVLEHVADVQPFVDAIFATATYRVILSVPYRWPSGKCTSHVHDPVNRTRLRGWAKRRPIRTRLLTDVGLDRLVEEYQP
jgi:hypothetical protein